MNTLNRIKNIDMQLKSIKYDIAHGNHVGAGLSIGVSIGRASTTQNTEGYDNIIYDDDMELTAYTSEILELIVKSLEDSRKVNVSFLKGDLMAYQKSILEDELKITKAKEAMEEINTFLASQA